MYGELMLVRRRGGQTVYFLLGLLAAGAASANPQGAQVAAGAASFATPNPQTLEITNSPSAILNWQSFDIGVGETTRFIQQDAASAVLNRVTTQNSSEIFGNLVSNGQVFLVNPSGILIGRDASVDTAGLVMSTLQMSDADFLAGRLHFEGAAASGPLINHGYIKTGPGGEIVLIAPIIENSPDGNGANSGLIESAGGELILAAGHSITIASLDHPDITFDVQAPSDEVINLGKLLAEGGSINVLAGTIRHSGEINADSLSMDAAGHIVLAASDKVILEDNSVTSASGQGAGGDIAISAGGAADGGRVYQMGEVRADGGTTGGVVSIDGTRVLASGALTARGGIDGGRVEVKAADQILATSASHIDASGVEGQGGTVVVDGGKSVYTSGLIRASGLVGGTVHVFGDDTRLAAAVIDTSGVGGGGTVRVGGGFQGGENLPTADNTEVNGSSVIRADALTTGNGGSVVLWADGTMRYAGTVSARGGSAGGNGGTVEVSGKQALGFNGIVDVSAAAGQAGSLLLDPKNVRFTSEVLTGAPISLLDPNPGAGNSFGDSLNFLYDDGNFSTPAKIIVYDDLDDFGGSDAGAVYLFRASDGALLSTLTGSQAGDRVGSSNFLQGVGLDSYLRSPLWNGSRGAITLFDPVNGTSGVVSSSNSLVGANVNDQIGSGGFFLLDAMHIAVRSAQFDGTRGALTIKTIGNLTGVVSSSNSLVGANVGDFLSSQALTNLFNGQYVQRSNHGGAGAVTYITPTSPTVGVVSGANSLVGSGANDGVGNGGISQVSGSTWVIRSPFWDNGAASDAGAVTVFDANTGRFSGTATALTGAVSAGNSLVGSTLNDQVGANGIGFVFNGRFGVFTPSWDNGATADVGAITWYVPGASLNGTITASNSLIGNFAGDSVGGFTNDVLQGGRSNGIYYLSGSTNAVLKVPNFNSGAGALTFLSSVGAPPVGAISASNSVVGKALDSIVSGGLQQVSGALWAIMSPDWDALAPAADDAGAVSFFNAATGQFSSGGALFGLLDASNSLVGSTDFDRVGSNGIEYVFGAYFAVLSPDWDNGGASDAGAATWFTAASPLVGAVSTANSLVGAFAGDDVGGSNQYYSLGFSGNSLLHVPAFSSNGGAVVFINDSAPPVGTISSSNALVGSSGDAIGSGGIEIENAHYLVLSPLVDDGSNTDAGAVTIGTHSSGIVGFVNTANSLVGSITNALIGDSGWFSLGNGNGLISGSTAVGQPGSVTYIDLVNGRLIGDSDFAANVDSTNSLIGNVGDQVGFGDQSGNGGITVYFAGANHYYIVNSSLWDAGGTFANAGAVTVADANTGIAGLVNSGNSIVGGISGDGIGRDGIIGLQTGNALIYSRAYQASAGALTFLDLINGQVFNDTDFAAIVNSSNSLTGGSPGDDIGGNGIGQIGNGFSTFYYQVLSESYDNTGAGFVDNGAVTFADSFVGIAGVVGPSNSIVGAADDNDRVGSSNSVFGLSSGNVVILSKNWNNDTGAATFVDIVNFTGLSGAVSSTNSIIGAAPGDLVGSAGIRQFSGSDVYAVLSPQWANGANAAAGAVTWANQLTGMSGVVGLGNSLVGQFAGDLVGDNFSDFEQITSNLWVLNTAGWDSNKSALTFFDISNAVPVGAVGIGNSLVGSTAGDDLGGDGIDVEFTTSGTKILVASSAWDNGANIDAGAITVFLESAPATGVIDASNSLIGDHSNDSIGGGYRVFLNNGNRLLVHSQWDAQRGAVTFWDPDNALVGVVDASNSLVGGTAGDLLGNWNVSETAGGRYYVAAPDWDSDRGAVTFGSTTTGVVGVVSASNSLVGSTSGDRIGQNITDLFFNDKLAISSQTWNANRGAVTFVDPLAPTIGAVSASNSIVGANSGDLVGTTLTQLFGTANRGTVVLRTTTFNANAGAVTVVDSDAAFVGIVSELNSLVGRPGDRVGLSGVSEQNNGALLVRSAQWSDGAGSNFGAVTLMPATAGALTAVKGFVSATNSLVGSNANDAIGSFVSNTNAGNLIVRSTTWDASRGSVSFINIDSGRTGVVSDQNSLVGELAGDLIGNGGISQLGGDRFIVFSPNASVNGLLNAGRLDIIDGAVAQDVSGDIGFGADPGGELLISIGSLVNFLNSGGTLNVQATNDIHIGLGQSIVTSGGSLFLQAGRSIEIGADLILGGPGSTLSLIANDSGSDPQFRDAGDGNVTLKAEDGPLRVMATTLIVEAQNIVLEAGTTPGASVALIGLGTAELQAHGSGLISLTGGTAPGSSLTGVSAQDIFANFLADPTTLTAPASFILGQNSLTLIADDIVLQGGGSDGAFAAVVSFGDFSVNAINIDLLAGSATNTDAVLLGLGGNAELTYVNCELCGELLLGDPLLDDLAQGGVYISGIFAEPTVNAILAMLDNKGDADDEDDEDEDEDDEKLECN